MFMLRRHAYVQHVMTSIYVHHIAMLLCSLDCNVKKDNIKIEYVYNIIIKR
jgi:hypothetical protein